MPIILMASQPAAERPVALEMNEALTGRVGGFLELSQMLTGRVPERELVLDTYLTGQVPGAPSAAHVGQVLDLVMTAGGMAVESFQYSAERGQGARLDVTVIGDARGASVPPISVMAGGLGAVFAVPGTLPEWEAERTAAGWTTTLHATDRALIPQTTLPELVPWETQEAKDARRAQEQALRAAKVPEAQRAAALRDGRRMAVDAVVLAALATVPHRLLIPAPFPGYDFRADGGPTYSTAGKTAQEVVADIWGRIGITAGWEDGLLTIRAPGPTGDVLLPAPVESERIERITLDAPVIELEGGEPAGADPNGDDDGDGIPNGEDPDWDRDPTDPTDPDRPENSPDPDERDGNGSSGFEEGISPTPQPGEVAATAVPLSWEAVPHASQYVLERVEGQATPYTLWSRVAITTATRYTDDTVRPLTTYTYRLRVNATAIAGDERRNTIWQPSEWALVVTPPADVDAPPHPPENLTAYARSSTAVGVKWEAPKADPEEAESPRRGPADRYRVDVRTLTPDATLLRRVETAQTWAVPDGLPVGGQVRVQVYAINEQGDSEPALLDVQLVNLPPGPVEGLSLKAEDRTLTAEWERASGATGFEVRWALAPVGAAEAGLDWKLLPPVPVPTVPQDGERVRPSVALTGLDWATRYAVQVRGTNDVGAGVWSDAAYELTDSEPPQPEPDPEADEFESGKKRVLRLYRSTKTQTEYTTIWKTGSRVDATQVDLWGDVPIYRREKDERGERVVERNLWGRLKTTTARYLYEIPGWPRTLTASVEETVLYNTEAIKGRSDIEIGREQEKVHQEWSPQGWLNRRTTWRSKASVVKVKKDDDGEVTERKYGNMHETVREQWQPIGDGLWYYNRSGVMTTLLPTLVDDEWEDVEAGFKATPSETSVSEQAPPQATMPSERDRKKAPPPLPRNTSSPALESYPLDKPWFETPPSSGPGGGGEGDEDSEGDDRDDGPPPPSGRRAGRRTPSPRPAAAATPAASRSRRNPGAGRRPSRSSTGHPRREQAATARSFPRPCPGSARRRAWPATPPTWRSRAGRASASPGPTSSRPRRPPSTPCRASARAAATGNSP
ncbi:fibronectin type III domain-containing protein [Deinococcus sp. YIM 77859]|uniref:fibronectin type III domain-containing protein n=1 Tax=Deinococcus sp. YIM 77859 TaxID=1540221 RepID=UPI000550FB22|nr:fibronectin type III domain-containing protein [Deinococcus sp. YIM 77859]